MWISLLGLLDKKKSRRNLPFAFAVNSVKNLVYFFHALSASYSVRRAFKTKLFDFFSLLMIQVYFLKVFSLLFCKFRSWSGTCLLECSRKYDLQTCFTHTSFKGLSIKLAKYPFLFYENQNWKQLANETWMHKMPAVILWNSCFTRVGERWLCINYNAKNKKQNANFGLQSSNILVQGLFLKLWKCSVLINTNQTWEPSAKKLEGIKFFQSFFEIQWHVKTKRIHL